jgi:hypothetical protein
MHEANSLQIPCSAAQGNPPKSLILNWDQAPSAPLSVKFRKNSLQIPCQQGNLTRKAHREFRPTETQGAFAPYPSH